MCGITGWVDFKKQLVQEKQTMDRMTDTLSKRGPDDSNVWGAHSLMRGCKARLNLEYVLLMRSIAYLRSCSHLVKTG